MYSNPRKRIAHTTLARFALSHALTPTLTLTHRRNNKKGKRRYFELQNGILYYYSKYKPSSPIALSPAQSSNKRSSLRLGSKADKDKEYGYSLTLIAFSPLSLFSCLSSSNLCRSHAHAHFLSQCCLDSLL